MTMMMNIKPGSCVHDITETGVRDNNDDYGGDDDDDDNDVDDDDNDDDGGGGSSDADDVHQTRVIVYAIY